MLHPDLYVMEGTFYSQLKALHLAAFRPLSVYDQLQQARCAVGINRPVIQKTQVQTDSGLKAGQQAKTEEHPLLLFPRDKTPEHHSRTMVFQHLHISDQIAQRRIVYLRKSHPAARCAKHYRTSAGSLFLHHSVPRDDLIQTDFFDQ